MPLHSPSQAPGSQRAFKGSLGTAHVPCSWDWSHPPKTAHWPSLFGPEACPYIVTEMRRTMKHIQSSCALWEIAVHPVEDLRAAEVGENGRPQRYLFILPLGTNCVCLLGYGCYGCDGGKRQCSCCQKKQNFFKMALLSKNMGKAVELW